MTERTMNPVLGVLLDQVRQTRAAYMTGVAGVTVEDMQAAARRYLEMRASFEAAKTGKRAKRITKGAVAGLLRGL